MKNGLRAGLLAGICMVLAPFGAARADALRITACGGAHPPSGVSAVYMDATGNLCTSAVLSGSVSAATTATASATPTTVLAGAGKALNVDLHSALFEQPVIAGVPVDGTHGMPVVGTVTAQVSTGNAATTPHICGSHVFKHITTATDTQIVAQSGTTTIYVCDYSISFNGTGNIYLEKATSGTCGTLTQIDQAWFGVANAGKISANPYYSGLNTGASAQLCANTSAGVTIDIAVNYDQY